MMIPTFQLQILDVDDIWDAQRKADQACEVLFGPEYAASAVLAEATHTLGHLTMHVRFHCNLRSMVPQFVPSPTPEPVVPS